MIKVLLKTGRATLLFASIAALALGGGNAALAKSMKKQNLVDLMSQSDSILIGTVTEKADGFHHGLPYTEVTLDVGRSVKGNHGSTYSFRQFGLIAPKAMGNGRVNMMVTPAGWPTYAKGEKVMLFLHKAASETGFQTTAGLDQGKFTIRDNEIANGVNNEQLFSGIQINGNLSQAQKELVSQPSGAYKIDDFISLISTAVSENWIENGVMTNAD